MRLTIVHLLAVTFLFATGTVVEELVLGHGPDKVGLGLILGLALNLVLTGSVLRWLCVWPLIPKCPRCGMWVLGFHRAAGPEGLLLVASPCEHGFVMKGAWVSAPLRLPSSLKANVAEELGWSIRPDGRVFRFRADYAAVLLDEDGQENGRRRARWPYWLVRWTSA